MYEDVLKKELERYGLFSIYARTAKDEKIKKLYQALARAEEIALISLMRNLGKEPYKDALALGEEISKETKFMEEKMREAINAKNRKIATNMKFLGVIKKNMSEILEFPEDFRKIYVCPMCGYIVKDEAPEVCPLCNAPGDSFERFEVLG